MSQLTREQESAGEPKGGAQLMQVNGGLNADGSVAAYDFQTSYPSNTSPTLALLLTRAIKPVAQVFEMATARQDRHMTLPTCAWRLTTWRHGRPLSLKVVLVGLAEHEKLDFGYMPAFK